MNPFHKDPDRIPVFVRAVRTPIGKYGGALKDIRPDDMAALVLAEVLKRASCEPHVVDEVILGCANQAGEDNRNIARMALLLAGFPENIPGMTVNRLCASSLSAIIEAARQIVTGDADVIVAGGVESMSRAPYSIPKNTDDNLPFGNLTAYDTALGWRYPNPKIAKHFPLESMGETAENLYEQYHISREEQDVFALQSHMRAVEAQTKGVFRNEIVPVEIVKRKQSILISDDEGPRADTTLEKLAALKPAFRTNGTVTAGNSSSLNDGAAAVLIMSASKARELGLTPMARFVSSGTVGVNPRTMGLGPVPATRIALQRADLTLSEIDLVELNEAFAVQALCVIEELGLNREKVNPNGGAIALGHPLGCSGARITTTLIHEMSRRDSRYGLATMCVGVGQGVAMIIEKL